MRVSEDFLRTVDDWRRGQTDLPSRAEAIRTGAAVRAALPRPPFSTLHRPAPPLFLPDGRVLGPGVDPLTGAPLNAPR